jgi:hypothetical protein
LLVSFLIQVSFKSLLLAVWLSVLDESLDLLISLFLSVSVIELKDFLDDNGHCFIELILSRCMGVQFCTFK